MMSSKGSLWKKWDLHVHTPESLFHCYPGNKEQAWEQFLDDLEALPLEFKVLGINDYIFIDGYRQICEERKKGRLENIELVLPVIELRLKMFGGTESKLSRVNFHVIFSDELDCDLIECQFLNALRAKYTLSPQYAQYDGLNWSGLPNRQGLENLGKSIIATVPENERSKFGSPLVEGFNNLNLDIRVIQEALDSHYFADKFITAVGKTEWSDIQWNNHSIADKKNIINDADLVLIAAETPRNYEKARKSLQEGNVNSKLLDCSDAHYLSSSEQKDRIGNCFTWIKGDTTFKGLNHALKEFNHRVHIGKPEILSRVQSEGSRFINSIEIQKIPNSPLDEVWFDTKIDLHPGLVAIIGNKGSGKSALAEVLALLGNSSQEECYYSFFNQQKFCQKGNNKASHFCGKLEWANGNDTTRLLSAPHEDGALEQVTFIPQNFLETICNEVPHGEETSFDRELKRVIYSHVDSTERLGLDSLDQLISFKTKAIEENLDQLRKTLMEINKRIVDLEYQNSPAYRQKLRNSLKSVLNSLRDLRRARPKKVPKPKTTERQEIMDEINAKKTEQEVIIKRIDESKKKLTVLNKNIANLDNISMSIKTIEDSYKDFMMSEIELAKEVGIDLEAIIKLSVDWVVINELRKIMAQEKKDLEDILDANKTDSLLSRQKAVVQQIKGLQHQLDAPNQEYQAYLIKLGEWQKRRRELIGATDQTDTALYYRARLHELNFIPDKLSTEMENRRTQTKLIHQNILELVNKYKELYGPIQEFIGDHPVNKEIKLTFNVTIVDRGFVNGLFDFINRAIAGSFYGMIESNNVIGDLLATHDLNDTDSVIEFVEEITQRLHKDFRVTPPTLVNITSQLKKGKTIYDLYDYIHSLSFLEPRYAIEFSGKKLHELSPGEKGTLLLLFYLLVDKNKTPLIIDQPEDNLDNETVFNILVNCIKDARRRRQIIIVTHNPNLAVVCDADQVIVASMDKENGNVVSYTCGSIENPIINQKLIDILEGTWFAFNNRDLKYFMKQ